MRTKNRFISLLMAASIAASLCTPAWAAMDVTTSADGIAGGNKDITVGVSGVDASDDVIYGTTIIWEDPTFTYTVDGGASTRWDPETHTYASTAGAVSGSFDKNSIAVKVYNHSNAKIDASCFVGASADATTTSYNVSGYDVTLAVSNPDGNAATLPAPEPNSELDAVSTTFTLGISGDGMNQYASDLIAGAANEAKMGTVVVVIGKVLSLPILAPADTWYKPTAFDDVVRNPTEYNFNKADITTLTLVDAYVPTGNETESWDASAAGDGSVMCYLTGTDLIMSGNGSGRIIANEDSSDAFSFWYNHDTGVMSKLTAITGLDILDTSSVVCMARMFMNSSGAEELDVSGFDTSNVTNMSYMFGESYELRYSPIRLTSLDVSNFNTSNVTDMRGMFSGLSKVTSLDVSSFNTSSVTSTAKMFRDCSNLTKLDLSNFDTSQVTDMKEMFDNCCSLTSMDASNFDTSNVTNMGYMFSNCIALTHLDVSGFVTSNVTNMGGMFNSCNSLTSIDVSSFDTSNVAKMGTMFHYCSALTDLDLSNFDTSKVTDMQWMFRNCENLQKIYVSELWTAKGVAAGWPYGKDVFEGCMSLKGAIDYDSSKTDVTYANYTDGYLTYKAA